MSDTSAHFHLALAQVSAVQLLRSTGIDRARPSVVHSLADLLVGHLQLLGEKSKEAAASAGRCSCELEDLREALERVGSITVARRQNVREDEGVLRFISWCMSDDTANMRRIAGEGQNEMGEQVGSDWLEQLIDKQIQISGEDKFLDSVLSHSGKKEESGSPKAHLLDTRDASW